MTAPEAPQQLPVSSCGADYDADASALEVEPILSHIFNVNMDMSIGPSSGALRRQPDVATWLTERDGNVG
jgi:hypothetical protein